VRPRGKHTAQLHRLSRGQPAALPAGRLCLRPRGQWLDVGGNRRGQLRHHLQRGQRPGVDIDDWHLCADQQSPTPDWPASGSGNVITFDGLTNSQVGGNAVIGARAVLGYFYCGAHTPDTFRISPHPAWNMGNATILGRDDDLESFEGIGWAFSRIECRPATDTEMTILLAVSGQ
jgi:hypothetical protein